MPDALVSKKVKKCKKYFSTSNVRNFFGRYLVSSGKNSRSTLPFTVVFWGQFQFHVRRNWATVGMGICKTSDLTMFKRRSALILFRIAFVCKWY
jgi:hypothetical protein